MSQHRNAEYLRRHSERRFEKHMNQPRRYHQWCNSVTYLKYNDDGEPIMPSYPRPKYDPRKTAILRENNRIIDRALMGGCAMCGYKYNLTFHHVEEKRFNIMDKASMSRVHPETMMEEISKCIVLCRPCHTWIHAVEGR